MAAAQAFISGAISKTINLRHEATEAEVKDCYLLSWKLGVKACALYRDGSKLSQPLSNKSEKKKEETAPDLGELTLDKLLKELNERMQSSPDTRLKRQLSHIVERKTLPAKRRGYTHKGKVGGQALFVRTGEYEDGTLGEIFIDMAKEGATMRSLLNSFAIAVSVGLQYGVPLEEFVDKFIFTRFEPSGVVDHPNIKSATSVLDYIFRLLAYEYLDREDLVHVPDMNKPKQAIKEGQNPSNGIKSNGKQIVQPTPLKKRETALIAGTEDDLTTVKKLMGTSSDAPACLNCGNITLRNGTCYMCPNCGTTTGCV